MMHHLEKDVPHASLSRAEEFVCIIDGNALLHALVNRPDNFESLAKTIFDALPKAKPVDFVTDSYHSNGIKEVEQDRRGKGKTFLIKGPKTKVPRDWQKFLLNADNKTQLVKLVLGEWKEDTYAESLHDRCIFFVSGEHVTQLTSADGVVTSSSIATGLCSTQPEADTRIILHCLHASTNNTETTIVVRSPDTDVFLLLLKYAQGMPNNVLFDTGVANKRRLLDIKAIIIKHGAEKCRAYLALHAITGCDTVSAFVRRGKLSAIKLLNKQADFIATFILFGTTPTVSDEMFAQLEHFVCCLYGYQSYTDINKLRYDIFRQRFSPRPGQTLSSYDGVDISLLPICKSTLLMHIKRANYQAFTWNCADHAKPQVPTPENHGWKFDESGRLVIDWMMDSPLPDELLDIVADQEDDNSSDEDNEVDYSNITDLVYGEEYEL